MKRMRRSSLILLATAVVLLVGGMVLKTVGDDVAETTGGIALIAAPVLSIVAAILNSFESRR